MDIRPEKNEDRPRLRFERIISSNSVILGSFDFGEARSRSPINSLKPAVSSQLAQGNHRGYGHFRTLTLGLL